VGTAVAEVAASPAERQQGTHAAYQRKLALVTSALKAQGSTFELHIRFSSAATDVACLNASLGGTSTGDGAALITRLLSEAPLATNAGCHALERALQQAADDYEAAELELAATRRADALRRELEAAVAAVETARQRRKSAAEAAKAAEAATAGDGGSMSDEKDGDATGIQLVQHLQKQQAEARRSTKRKAEQNTTNLTKGNAHAKLPHGGENRLCVSM
jgi:hypothetical protein